MTSPATRSRREWRTVDGIVLLDKPLGMTSNQALQRVRRIYNARKAGHTGSLDPLATGVLPLCFGQATKVAGLMLDADKRYQATVALGARTATGDREGAVVERRPVPSLDADQVAAVLAGFLGASTQIPPMYSALKRDGQALYALARQGIEVERPPRAIRIIAIELLSLGPEALEFDVTCSKGTYVRTLGEDIAAALGTTGHLSALRRTDVGGALSRLPAYTFEALEALADDLPALDALLLPPDTVLGALPAITLSIAATASYLHGRVVEAGSTLEGQVRVYAADGGFLGVAESEAATGRIRPLRLMATLD
ncbi:MAG: tRNA pseudouridine(55) synthase TruB [Pseudomonadota bacterium]